MHIIAELDNDIFFAEIVEMLSYNAMGWVRQFSEVSKELSNVLRESLKIKRMDYVECFWSSTTPYVDVHGFVCLSKSVPNAVFLLSNLQSELAPPGSRFYS